MEPPAVSGGRFLCRPLTFNYLQTNFFVRLIRDNEIAHDIDKDLEKDQQKWGNQCCR